MEFLAIALVLMFVLHLIDKHNRWRQAFMLTLGLLSFGIVGVSGFYGWQMYLDHRRQDQQQAMDATTGPGRTFVETYDANATPPVGSVVPDAELDCASPNRWNAPSCSVLIGGRVAAFISRREVKDNLAGWNTVTPSNSTGPAGGVDCYDSEGNLLPDEAKAFGGYTTGCGPGGTAKPVSERANVPPAQLHRVERIEACEKRAAADPNDTPAMFKGCRETK